MAQGDQEESYQLLGLGFFFNHPFFARDFSKSLLPTTQLRNIATKCDSKKQTLCDSKKQTLCGHEVAARDETRAGDLSEG